MVEYFLKLDYALSVWFSKSKDKIVPGAAFLFLNMAAFIWAVIFFLFLSLADVNLHVYIFIGTLVTGVLVIMYGLQKPIERIVRKGSYIKEYQTLSRNVIYRRRILAIFYLIMIFALMFLVGVLSMNK